MRGAGANGERGMMQSLVPPSMLHISPTPRFRYGPDRRKLPGPLGSAPHLEGLVAGDAGFDPLGLAVDPAAFRR